MKSSKIGFIYRLAIDVVLIAMICASCGPVQNAAKSLATCSAQAAVQDLLPTVESILVSGIDNWRDQLAALGKAFGMDALACAIAAAESAFNGNTAIQLVGSDAASTAAGKAHAWLAENGYR